MFADMMRYGNDVGQRTNDRLWANHPMMWWGGSGSIWIFGILCLVTWILVIVALIALIRLLWKKGDKVK